MEKRKFALEITSIVLNFLIFAACFTCITIMFFRGASFRGVVYSGFEIFKFFTILANLFLAIGCLICGIYKIINLKNKTDIFPYWLTLVKLSSTACAFFTFFISITYLGYRFSYAEMFGGLNAGLHYIIPWFAVICFGIFDRKYTFKLKDMLLALIPLGLYGLFYVIFVLSGVSEDLYLLAEGWLSILIAIVLFAFCFLIIFLLQLFNKLVFRILEIKIRDTSYVDDSLQLYTSKIFRAIFVIAICAGFAAAFTYTTCWIYKPSSFSPEVSAFLVLGFDVVCLAYTFIGLFFITKSFDKEGNLKRIRLIEGKIMLAILIPAQWNFLTYAFPTTVFWGFAFFFIILVSFFFDYKLVDVVSAEILLSLVISWIVNPTLLPPQNDQFVLNMTLRVVCLVLGCISLHIATYFGGIFLVKELEKSAEFDPLTLLKTRKFMYRYLDECFKDKNSQNFCIAMVDIDNFKSINDTYGHLVGDKVLKNICAIIRTNVGENDTVFRYGGEEILIVFKADFDKSSKLLENILELLRKTEHHDIKDERSITISAGLVEKSDFNNYTDLIAEADKRLYHAKQNGKDQICKSNI